MEEITKEIAEELLACKERYEGIIRNSDAAEVSREQFTLLLSGVSMCRKLPGVPLHMGYNELYHCKDEEDTKAVKEHLAKIYGIKDKDTLLKACFQIYAGSKEYEHFMTFWNNAPLFDVEEMQKEVREGFTYCKEIAAHFYPIVREKGLYAWDVDQRIGLCRAAVACDLITEEEFWKITDVWVRQVLVFYHSFAEYAISSLCGAIYEMARHRREWHPFFDITRKVVDSLFAEGAPWQSNSWYTPEEREWAVLLPKNLGCFVTKRALEEERIGYMYHEEPSPNHPDSGWRFFVGDETDEYVNNPENISVCGLNTVCNLWPDVMALLNAEVGRRFGRQESGWVEE